MHTPNRTCSSAGMVVLSDINKNRSFPQYLLDTVWTTTFALNNKTGSLRLSMPGSLGYRGCWAPPRPAQAGAAPLRLFGSPCPSLAGGRCPAATGRLRAAGPGGRGRWRHRIPSVPPARPSRPGTAPYRCCLPLPSAPGGTGPGPGQGRGRGGEGEASALPGGCCDGGAGGLRAAQEDRGAHRIADQRRVRHPGGHGEEVPGRWRDRGGPRRLAEPGRGLERPPLPLLLGSPAQLCGLAVPAPRLNGRWKPRVSGRAAEVLEGLCHRGGERMCPQTVRLERCKSNQACCNM